MSNIPKGMVLIDKREAALLRVIAGWVSSLSMGDCGGKFPARLLKAYVQLAKHQEKTVGPGWLERLRVSAKDAGGFKS